MPQKKPQSSNKAKTLLYTIVALVAFTATAGQVDLTKVDWSDLSTIVNMLDLNGSQFLDYGRLEEIPEYDGENTVVTINHNQPNFIEEELLLTNAPWQKFSPLDRLNRVGPADAMLHQSMTPTVERGDISNVYPTGWKQKKLTDGKWLYNRSHLIAFRLTGENDNWQNLFTGTQQMNQQPMKEYEDQVANYLRSSSNHVRYRVTPHFLGDELVPRGVQIEAQSIENNDLSFNVFLYNIQDGYSIDYLTGNSEKTE